MKKKTEAEKEEETEEQMKKQQRRRTKKQRRRKKWKRQGRRKKKKIREAAEVYLLASCHRMWKRDILRGDRRAWRGFREECAACWKRRSSTREATTDALAAPCRNAPCTNLRERRSFLSDNGVRLFNGSQEGQEFLEVKSEVLQS